MQREDWITATTLACVTGSICFVSILGAHLLLRACAKAPKDQSALALVPPTPVEGVNDQLEPYICEATWFYSEEAAVAHNAEWASDKAFRVEAGDEREQIITDSHRPIWAYNEDQAREAFPKVRPDLKDADEITCRRADCYMQCSTQQIPAGTRRVYFSTIDPVLGSPTVFDSNEYGFAMHQCTMWAQQCSWEDWRDVDLVAEGWCPSWCRGDVAP